MHLDCSVIRLLIDWVVTTISVCRSQRLRRPHRTSRVRSPHTSCSPGNTRTIRARTPARAQRFRARCARTLFQFQYILRDVSTPQPKLSSFYINLGTIVVWRRFRWHFDRMRSFVNANARSRAPWSGLRRAHRIYNSQSIVHSMVGMLCCIVKLLKLCWIVDTVRSDLSAIHCYACVFYCYCLLQHMNTSKL